MTLLQKFEVFYLCVQLLGYKLVCLLTMTKGINGECCQKEHVDLIMM